VLVRPSDVGLPTVEVAAAALKPMAGSLEIDTRRADLVSGVGVGELADADIVLGGLDSRRARLELLDRVALADGRLVDGGTHPWGGEVRLRLARDEPGFSCGLTAAARAEPDSPISCAGLVTDGPAPASVLTTSLVGAWMSTLAVRVLLGHPPAWRFLDIDTASGTTAPVIVNRNPDCPYHTVAEPVTISVLDQQSTVGQFLSTFPAGAEPLSWGVFSLPGTCYQCGGTFDPGPRYVRGRFPCPHCGRANRPRLTRTISTAAPEMRLAELGVASQEILTVRMPEGEFRWLRLSHS
jgi:predicted RNA-binding Zn-ribbon protein involved in translation (DUF1610 family)